VSYWKVRVCARDNILAHFCASIEVSRSAPLLIRPACPVDVFAATALVEWVVLYRAQLVCLGHRKVSRRALALGSVRAVLQVPPLCYRALRLRASA
jgi:hypothetical protein